MVSNVSVRVLGADNWSTWRDLRLRALADSPDAFGSTYARECLFDEAEWREDLADPAVRGRRVAAALLASVDAWAAERGMRLHLDVTTTNAAARRTYERYGFAGTGQTRPLRDGAAEVVERLVLA